VNKQKNLQIKDLFMNSLKNA